MKLTTILLIMTLGACAENGSRNAEIRTDTNMYAYQASDSGTPLNIRVTLTNKGSTDLKIRRCVVSSGPLVQVIRLSATAPQLGLDPSCTGGNPPILVQPGTSREDIISMAPQQSPPRGSQFDYQIEYLIDDYDAGSSTNAPTFATVRSNTFTVRYD